MKNIMQSASKLVFILLAASACVGFFMGILEPKDFMLLAGMAFSFYFANKGDTPISNTVTTTTATAESKSIAEVPPYLGK